MDKIFTDFKEYFDSVTSLVDELQEYLSDKPVPRSLKEAFSTFNKNGSVYKDLLSSNALHSEKGLASAKNVTTAGCLIGYAANKFKNADNEIKSLGDKILNESQAAQDLIENTPVNYEDLSPIGSDISSSKEIDKKENTEKNLHNEYEAYERRVKKITSESEGGLNDQVQHLTYQVGYCHDSLLSTSFC